MRVAAGTGRLRNKSKDRTRQRARARTADATVLRQLATRAERRYDTHELLDVEDATSEPDDAPTADDVPEWTIGDNEDSLVDPDDRLPWEETGHSHLPRPRLALFSRADGTLDHEVFLQVTGDPGIDRSLEEMYDKWDRMAETLTQAHPEALRESTLLGAFRALRPHSMKELETSGGQGSRDRYDLVRTSFGTVPLWFFTLGQYRSSNNDMFRDLEELGAIVLRDGLTRLSKGDIERALPRSRASAETLRKHGPALLAVISQSDVVARHRDMWPTTTLDALNRDLGRKGSSPKSEEVLALALFGAFSTEVEDV